MDRLAKKAVITSSILHGTLLLLLVVGPAFLPSEEPIEAKQFIDFIPYKTLETTMSGGGNPNVEQRIPVKPPEPAPTPAPAPQPRPREEPPRREEPKRQEPPKSDPKPAPKEEDAGWKARDASKIKVNLNQSIRAESTKKPTPPPSRSDDAAKAFDSAATTIGSKASAPVQIELRGPGGGGIPYAGFNDALVSAYMRAWLIPDDLASSSAKVKVKVTLRRDGTVISSSIQTRSGNSALDSSVQRALDKVTFVAPFPDSVKDAQKTFWLEFDPRAKRMVG